MILNQAINGWFTVSSWVYIGGADKDDAEGGKVYDDEEDAVTYSYSFFHLMLMLGTLCKQHYFDESFFPHLLRCVRHRSVERLHAIGFDQNVLIIRLIQNFGFLARKKFIFKFYSVEVH